MADRDFTTSILVDRSPKEVFDAINRPRDWWGKDIEGQTDSAGQEWTYRYKDMHFSKQRTAELVPDRKVVWHVVEARMNFLQDKTEWEGTKMIFDISGKGDKTEIRFTHAGLVPEVECFDICKNAWTGLIADSLRNLVETGEGLPDTVE